jgi:hypothetical protein
MAALLIDDSAAIFVRNIFERFGMLECGVNRCGADIKIGLVTQKRCYARSHITVRNWDFGMLHHPVQHRSGLRQKKSQMPQWNAFADAFRASGQTMAQHCAMMKEHGGAMMSADLPERLNMREQHMTIHLDFPRAIKSAEQPLYAVLSDEQKKTANEILKGPMGMM